jgi:hypothetical protein
MYDPLRPYPKIKEQKPRVKDIDKRQAYSALIKGFLRIPIKQVTQLMKNDVDNLIQTTNHDKEISLWQASEPINRETR